MLGRKDKEGTEGKKVTSKEELLQERLGAGVGGVGVAVLVSTWSSFCS